MNKCFLRLLGYNLIFFLLQTLFIGIKSQSFVSTLPLPKYVYWELGYTWYILGFSYVLLSIVQAICHTLFIRSWPQTSPKILLLLLISSSWIALLCLNIYYFPLSQYSRIIETTLPTWFISFWGVISLSILALIALNALFRLCQTYPLQISILILFCILSTPSPSERQPQSLLQPNIIIIGIDSLSPHFVQPQLTPTLWRFVNQSLWFQETISPLARTYPAWSTILSGLYPFHHEARYNLIAKDKAADASIAWTMKQAQYTTLYATDDRRFNLLDESFGFDHIIGPRRGVNDVLIGTFNDFLLGNLLINSIIGRWFFPYNHMNRASHFSYYPQTFDKALKKAIQTHAHIKPLFMAVHFTLPHWPYAYASSRHTAALHEYNITARTPLYRAALHDVDKEVAAFLAVLKENQLLQNTLMIVLSDHGETLYTPLSRPITTQHYQSLKKSTFETYLAQYTSTALDRSAGHGSDLLSPDQFHCLLAIQYYQKGKAQYQHEQIMDRVGLQDIAPTILEFTHHALPSLDGLSLRSRIEKKSALPSRAFILESGMLPNQFLSREKARMMGQALFEVDFNSTLLHIRDNKIAQLDKEKLYAILKDNWILALYPTTTSYLPVLQELSTHAWTDDLNSSFARNSPSQFLLKELSQFYTARQHLLTSP